MAAPMRALLVALLVVLALPTDAEARRGIRLGRIGGCFGTGEEIAQLADVALIGPYDEALFVGRKTTTKCLLLPYSFSDDGYVLGLRHQPRRYYTFPDPDFVRAAQAEGLLPDPLPPSHVHLGDYLWGHLLWLIVIVPLGLLLLVHFIRRRQLRVARAAAAAERAAFEPLPIPPTTGPSILWPGAAAMAEEHPPQDGSTGRVAADAGTQRTGGQAADDAERRSAAGVPRHQAPGRDEDPGGEPRLHHYLFAHRALPARLWEGDSTLGILANPENRDYLVELWNDIGRQVPPAARVPADGLAHTSYWIGGEHLVILVTMPEPRRSAEAYFAAITTSPQIRYLTLERTWPEDGVARERAEPRGVLCEWMRDGNHANLGPLMSVTSEEFLKALCRLMALPETVEPPTPQQRWGMTQGAPTMYVEDTNVMSPDDELQADAWTDEAMDAFIEDRLDEALAMHRRIQDFCAARTSPTANVVTNQNLFIAQTLLQMQRFDEAESLSRAWWKTCRRHRMLGHAETMSATRTLAETLHLQGKEAEARELMQYRVQLAGLARGKDSVVAATARQELESFPKLVPWVDDQPPEV